MKNKEKPKDIKNYISNYLIYILVFIIIILVILILVKDTKKETPKQEPSVLTMNLKGEKEVTVIVGNEFIDEGCRAYDSRDGDLTNRIIVENNANINEIGNYVIKYKVTNSEGTTKEETRTINVIPDLEVSIDYNPKELTNEDVTITLTVTGNILDYVLDPNKTIVKNNIVEFKASENKEYVFEIRRTNGTIINKTIEINNIDKIKPTGSCKNTITNEKTTITVEASDENGISKYVYNSNNKKEEKETATYTTNEIINNVSVTIYDKANNTETITCTKIDDTWPIVEKQNFQKNSARNYKSLRYNGRMNYLLYYPDHVNLTEKIPLIIYLHGYGEFGSDINNTLAPSSYFTNNMRSGKFQQKAIFLAPQCSAGSKKWYDCFDNLKGLINEVITKYNVDTNKITMTGHSLGGEGVFDFIVANPGFLAAAAPLAPSTINEDYTKMKDLKIAVFIGTKDNLYTKDQPSINYLIQNGVKLKFIPLQDVSHSSQNAMFNGTNVIDWLITQSK